MLALAVSAATALALLEYNNLSTSPGKDKALDFIFLISGASLPALSFFFGTAAFLPALLASVFVLFTWSILKGGDLKEASYLVSFKALGLIYVAIPLSFLIPLRGLGSGQWWILFLLVVIWANDTFAYFTGKNLGRRKLAPAISLGKTIEGAIGGLTGGVIAAFIFDSSLGMGMGMAKVAVLSLLIGVIGIIGDLAESLLKRGAGVKDSGSIIPGHGGVLDRIDSLIFPIPMLYFILICQSRMAG